MRRFFHPLSKKEGNSCLSWEPGAGGEVISGVHQEPALHTGWRRPERVMV